MPTVPSGKTTSASSFCNSRRALSGEPTTWPQRGKNTLTKGSSADQRSTIERGKRGGSASSMSEVPMMRPSIGICPEWLAMISTLPSGTCSTPKTSVRK